LGGMRSGSRTNEVVKAKLIALAEQSFALLVSVMSETGNEFDIQLRLYPANRTPILPTNICLRVLDAAGEVALETRATESQSWIELEFTGEPGDYFDVQVAIEDGSIVESFEI
jgi:hypothetical protein